MSQMIAGKIKINFRKDTVLQWLIAAWLFLLPFLCCVAYCLKTGNSIRDIYLPAGLWNDDIIYYKEVEGIVHYGIPQGYFGYSDTHALVGSLSVWSPVLLLFWSIWGVLFGWNYMSPIWCNIVMMMVGMGVFAVLARPNRRQTFWLTLFYISFIRLTRYALSAHVESTVYFMLMLILGLVMYQRRTDSRKALLAQIPLIMLLTWMRPYYIVLLAVPGYYMIKRNKKNSWIFGLIFLGTLVVYFLISHYLCAPYFDGGGLFDSSFLTIFFTDGIKAGIRNLLATFLFSVDAFLKYLGNSISDGMSLGENAGISYAIMFCCLIYKLVIAVRIRERQDMLRYGYWCSFFAIMFLAITFIFSIASGQKHLLGFTVMGLLLIAMDELPESRMWLVVFIFSYLFLMRSTDAGAYGIPYVDLEVQAEIQKGEEVLHREIQVTDSGPSYDNTVIWILGDVVDGEFVDTNWQMLYALPPGVGINVCLFDTLASDLSNVQSKYILVPVGGRTDAHCQDIGAKKLVEYGDSIVYQLRD